MLSGAKHLWLFPLRSIQSGSEILRFAQNDVLTCLVDPEVFICPAPAATGFWPHRLRVVFAGKEESRGAYRLDKIGR
jgi:hypothetical protein